MARSSAICQGNITCARSLTSRFLPTSMPRATSWSISPSKLGGLHDHAAGDDAKHAGRENAAGDERELIRLSAADHSMPGVRAPLVADDQIVLFGQQVHELSFGLVTPLQADNACAGQSGSLNLSVVKSNTAGRCAVGRRAKTPQSTQLFHWGSRDSFLRRWHNQSIVAGRKACHGGPSARNPRGPSTPVATHFFPSRSSNFAPGARRPSRTEFASSDKVIRADFSSPGDTHRCGTTSMPRSSKSSSQ